MAEENEDKVRVLKDNYISIFLEFESANDKFQSEEPTEEDEYYTCTLMEYTKTLRDVNKWFIDMSPTSTYNVKLAKLLMLPKLELEKFDGNPQEFLPFTAAFEESVENIADTDQEKLSRLLQLTVGVARDAVRSCTSFQQAKGLLKSRFGNCYLIAEGTIRELRSNIAAHTPAAIQKLADDAANAERVLKSLDYLSQIDTNPTIIDIVNRLTPDSREDWCKSAVKFRQDSGFYPNFHDLVVFLNVLADAVNDPVYGVKSIRSFNAAASVPATYSESVSSTSNYVPPKCLKCSSNHRLFHCKAFKSLAPIARRQFVVSNNLCENCFLSNHVTNNCRKNSVCDVPNCGEKHSRFIHVDPAIPVVHNCNANVVASSTVHLPVVPISINDSYKTSVLLDTASTSTFVTRKVVRNLGLNVKRADITHQLCTLNNASNDGLSDIVNLKLSSAIDSNYVSCSAFVVDSIPVTRPLANVKEFHHLKNVPLAGNCGDVDVLLGQDCADALIPIDVRRGSRGQPFATRTLLGWSLNGYITSCDQMASRQSDPPLLSLPNR